MAVNKVVYDGDTLIDLTGDTVTPDSLAEGVTAHAASGAPITGTLTAVQYGKSQSLNDSQKAQARTNIGAASSAELDRLAEAIEEIGTQEDIVQAVIAALGTPVFGTVDENKIITLKGDDLVSGTYTFVFEKANGTIVDIGTMAHTTYTNRIPLAIDTSGNIYNGTGYKAGYRLNSSAAETAYTAGTVTGFIPAVYGDTIYLKDVSFSPSFAEPGRLTLWGYDASFTPVVYGNLKAGAASGYVVDSAGNITQFPISEKMFVEKAGSTDATTAADFATMKYFRITCTGITADSVITVNEPIV